MRRFLSILALLLPTAVLADEVPCTEPALKALPYTSYTQRCYDLGVLDEVPSASCAATAGGVRRTTTPMYTQTTCYFRLSAMASIEVHAGGSSTGKVNTFRLTTYMPNLHAPEQWDGYLVFRNVPATGADGAPHRLVMLSAASWVGAGRMSYGATMAAQ